MEVLARSSKSAAVSGHRSHQNLDAFLLKSGCFLLMESFLPSKLAVKPTLIFPTVFQPHRFTTSSSAVAAFRVFLAYAPTVVATPPTLDRPAVTFEPQDFGKKKNGGRGRGRGAPDFSPNHGLPMRQSLAAEPPLLLSTLAGKVLRRLYLPYFQLAHGVLAPSWSAEARFHRIRRGSVRLSPYSAHKCGLQLVCSSAEYEESMCPLFSEQCFFCSVGFKGCKLVGCGSALPSLSISNDDLAKLVDTNDEWISVRTGIRNRRVLSG
nr:3-oxoacyl-[acyl-carrier-protein] synthase 3 A, chloroplastic-like [Ipomoea batatas]